MVLGQQIWAFSKEVLGNRAPPTRQLFGGGILRNFLPRVSLAKSTSAPFRCLDCVGRYTHRVAISNNRLLDTADGKVTFRYKDYRHDAQQKTMTLQAEEFIRRFLLHVLPEGFQRIRYYGFLANRYRAQKLARCRDLLGMPATEPATSEASKDYSERYEELTGSSLWQWPVCHKVACP
jgi:Putative transposase